MLHLMSEISSFRPIPLPLTNDLSVLAALKSLNTELVDWGYSDQPREILYRRLQAEASHALQGGQDPEPWLDETEAWIERGDGLIERIQAVMWNEVEAFCDGDLDLLREYWDTLSRVAYRVQYMMAIIEVRVDTVELGTESIPGTLSQ